jgi:hypothetical protein
VVTSAGVVYEPVTIDPCVLMPGRDFDDLVDFWLVSVGGDGCEAGFAKEVEAHVAAAFGPLVGLFGEHGADQADDRGPVSKDPDDVGADALSRRICKVSSFPFMAGLSVMPESAGAEWGGSRTKG